MNVIKPADIFPPIEFNMISGGTKKISDYMGGWAMLIVYRGGHCPRCKQYMTRLHELQDGYAERNVDILITSMDPENVVKRSIAENNWTLPIAHSLSAEDSEMLTLYLTPHEEGSELEGVYAEPGLFLINPEGRIQSLATSNSPSIRPDLEVVLDGIIGTQDRGLPIRGTAS